MEKEIGKIRFTLYGGPITKKNSMQIAKLKNGRHMLIQSRQYREYEALCINQIMAARLPRDIDQNINLKCDYYMPTKRKVDLLNLLAATSDIIEKAGIILDDKQVVSVDGSRKLYDKENPRVEVEIEILKD